jgi:hypothetical protein
MQLAASRTTTFGPVVGVPSHEPGSVAVAIAVKDGGKEIIEWFDVVHVESVALVLPSMIGWVATVMVTVSVPRPLEPNAPNPPR